MQMFECITSFFGDRLASLAASPMDEPVAINPATGLPMVSGMNTVDVAGNPFGTDHFGSQGAAQSGSMGGEHETWRNA